MHNNGSHMIQFYKRDVSVVHGNEFIQGVRLHENSHMVRIYCTKCGTALGAEGYGSVPILLLYSQFVTGHNMPIYLPSLVLNFASAPVETTRRYDTHTTVRQGMLGPVFLVRVVLRVVVGLLFGKGNGGGFLECNYENVTLGLESIETTNKQE